MIQFIKNIWEDYIVWYCYDKPKDIYKTIRCWYYCDALNPWHWKLVWYTMFHNRPWASEYIYELIELHIKKSNYYFTHRNIMSSEGRLNNILRWQKIALNLLHIINNEGEYWEWDFNKKGFDAYSCKVYVNTKNVKRFAVKGTDYETMKTVECYEYMLKEPHELYVEKARKLFIKILSRYSGEWWD